MKPLFICNPSQIQALKTHIKDNKIFKSADLNRCFISKNSDYKLRKNDLNGSGDAPFTRIYIDPFLEWNTQEYFGYQIALEVLENWKKKEAPGIVFISAITQPMFDKMVTGKMNSLVREFPHFDFMDLKEKTIPFGTFSNSRWKYLKAYALTSSGIVDEISHDLTTIISQNESSRTNLEKILKRVKSLSDTVGKEVMECIALYNEDTNVSTFAKALQEKIIDRLKELRPHKPSEIKVPSNMNLLIIEDNEEHLQVLEKSLTARKGYFEKEKTLFSYTNGEEALAELKSSKNEYQLVLVDLRLNDENGFAQAVHGVDIIEELQKNHPLTSYTIITGMGRKGISELLDIEMKFVLSKKQLYSFDTDSEVDTMLNRMFADVAQREKSIHYNFGPSGGIYGWTMFKSNLFALDNAILDAQKNKAFELLENFKSQNLNQELKVYSPKQKERYDTTKIDDYHTNILALRMIYLWLALKNKNKLTCNATEQDDFSQILQKNNISLSYGRAKDIGLAHTKSWTENEFKIVEFDLKKLWGHEKSIIKEWEEFHKEEFLNNLEDITISDVDAQLCSFLALYFDYEEDWPWPEGVTRDINSWNFKDLKIFLTTVFEDVLNNEETSFHYPFVKSMCDQDVTGDYFHHHIAPELAEVDKLYVLVDQMI
jgi:CheY-like chemotaxis protein